MPSNPKRADIHAGATFRVMPPSEGIDANWHVTDHSDTCVAHCFGFGHSVPEGEALAARVAAALNYCRGIPTEHLIAHASAAARGPLGREAW